MTKQNVTRGFAAAALFLAAAFIFISTIENKSSQASPKYDVVENTPEVGWKRSKVLKGVFSDFIGFTYKEKIGRACKLVDDQKKCERVLRRANISFSKDWQRRRAIDYIKDNISMGSVYDTKEGVVLDFANQRVFFTDGKIRASSIKYLND